jgi:hypothetical protein
VILGRGFAGVISTQLDLFEREHGTLIDACDEAERAYDAASREEAEERYGEFLDLVDEGAEILAEMRGAYAAMLDDRQADRYEAQFNRAAARRLPRLARRLADF